MSAAPLVTAYVPFLDPIAAVHDWSFLLLIPLAFGISMIYKAVRMPRLDAYWRQVAIMTTQVVVVMLLLAIGLAVVVELVVPLIPVAG